MSLLPVLTEKEHDGRIYLMGHLDRNNEHARELRPGAPVSFQFQGPDGYASPDLYPDAHLPGWLYVSVQGDGEVSRLLEGPELRELLIASTETFGESEQRFSLEDSDPRIDRFLPGIKGFRIRVTRISGIGKLAQDKGREHSQIAMRFLAGRDNAGSLPLFERILDETL